MVSHICHWESEACADIAIHQGIQSTYNTGVNCMDEIISRNVAILLLGLRQMKTNTDKGVPTAIQRLNKK